MSGSPNWKRLKGHIWKPFLLAPLKTYHLENLCSWAPLPPVIGMILNFVEIYHLYDLSWHDFKHFWHVSSILPVIGRQMEPNNAEHFWDHRLVHLADLHIVTIIVSIKQLLSPSGQVAVGEAGASCWLRASADPKQNPPWCQSLKVGLYFYKHFFCHIILEKWKIKNFEKVKP